eukprot:131511-Pleurochrysis_carterae.AAC.5
MLNEAVVHARTRSRKDAQAVGTNDVMAARRSLREKRASTDAERFTCVELAKTSAHAWSRKSSSLAGWLCSDACSAHV